MYLHGNLFLKGPFKIDQSHSHSQSHNHSQEAGETPSDF